MRNKIFPFFVLVSLTINLLCIGPSYSNDKIDPEWPVIDQYLVAVKQLYTSDIITKEVAGLALVTSKFIANDARYRGICKEWINASANCLTATDPIMRVIACKSMSGYLDEIYKDKLKYSVNITTEPEKYQNIHILAAYAMDEFLYTYQENGFVTLLDESWCSAMDQREMAQVGKALGNPGTQGPIGASGDASPKNDESVSCSPLSSIDGKGGGGVTDPAPFFGSEGPSPSVNYQSQIGTQIPGPDPCPINFGMTGGGAGGGGSGGGGDDGSGDGKDTITSNPPSKDNKGGNKGVPCYNGTCSVNFGHLDIQVTQLGKGGMGFVGGTVLQGLAAGHAGSFDISTRSGIAGAGIKFELPGFRGVVYLGYLFKLRPGPDADYPAGICGGGIASSINKCFSNEKAEEEKCREEVMKKCMLATCTEEMFAKCGNSSDGKGALDLTKIPGYGVTDPLGEDTGTTLPPDPCKGLEGKEKDACCSQNKNKNTDSCQPSDRCMVMVPQGAGCPDPAPPLHQPTASFISNPGPMKASTNFSNIMQSIRQLMK